MLCRLGWVRTILSGAVPDNAAGVFVHQNESTHAGQGYQRPEKLVEPELEFCEFPLEPAHHVLAAATLA